jgi:hypothetical protein
MNLIPTLLQKTFGTIQKIRSCVAKQVFISSSAFIARSELIFFFEFCHLRFDQALFHCIQMISSAIAELYLWKVQRNHLGSDF